MIYFFFVLVKFQFCKQRVVKCNALKDGYLHVYYCPGAMATTTWTNAPRLCEHEVYPDHYQYTVVWWLRTTLTRILLCMCIGWNLGCWLVLAYGIVKWNPSFVNDEDGIRDSKFEHGCTSSGGIVCHNGCRGSWWRPNAERFVPNISFDKNRCIALTRADENIIITERLGSNLNERQAPTKAYEMGHQRRLQATDSNKARNTTPRRAWQDRNAAAVSRTSDCTLTTRKIDREVHVSKFSWQ